MAMTGPTSPRAAYAYGLMRDASLSAIAVCFLTVLVSNAVPLLNISQPALSVVLCTIFVGTIGWIILLA